MKAFAGFRYSHVHIVESLAAGEVHTGRVLAGALRALSASASAVRFAEVGSSRDLNAKLAEIATGVADSGEIPILHLECHGTTDGLGIVLSSGEFVPWENLRTPLEEINVRCRLHLLLVLGLCCGAQILELVEPIQRAPFWGYVGSDKVVLAGDIEKGFPPFYSTLFETNDLVAATKELRQREPTFGALPVEHFFVQTYRTYLLDHFAPKRLRERALALARSPNAPPIRTLKRELLASRKNGFRAHRRTFFMADLFPENADRFRVSFRDVQSRQ